MTVISVERWTIKDAEDGDVLWHPYDGFIFIFKSLKNNNELTFYCGSYMTGQTIISRYNDRHFNLIVERIEDIHPADRDKKEILFTWLLNEGYKWNNETKTLEIV